LFLALGGASESPAAAACIPPKDGPRICVRVSHAPDAPSVSTAATPRYVSLASSVSNEGGNAVNHAALEIGPVDVALGTGFSFVELPTASAGSCSYSAAARTISCDLGQLRSGATVDVGLTLRTPTAEGVHGVTVTTVAGDITSDAGRKAVLAAMPEADILVNNAGGPPPGVWSDWSRDDFLKAIESNMVMGW